MGQYVNGQQQDVATTSSGLGAGAGDHLPIGDYGGMDYRSAMRFATPGWSGWTAITKATLKVFISDHKHVGPKNSSIYCSRMNITSPIWTKDQGTQDCENGFSAGNTTQYGDIQSVSTDRISFSSGSTANAAKTLDVTAMVRYYWSGGAGAGPIVFVFDNNGADQYTELWSLGKTGTTYDAVLTIDYDTNTPPTAPTLVSPGVGATVADDTPTFSWTHNDPQGNPQASAYFQLYNAAGTAIGAPVLVSGTTQTYTPAALTRGTTYQWSVQTTDAAGVYGPYATKQTFTVKALPVVTIDPVRYMVFASGAPRLKVKWTADQAQTHYRVQRTAAPAFDSGWIASGAQEYTLSTVALTDNVGVNVTVSVRSDPYPLEGSASRTITPRYGLTVHRRDLTPASETLPTGWGTPAIASTVPAGATLQIEYGSNSTAATAPTSWQSTISAVPKARYLYWRAWFIPSNSAGPTLDKITIPYTRSVAALDKWSTTKDGVGLVQGWGIDQGEYVYGTRSMYNLVPGAGPYTCYSYAIQVRANRSYILTGLMKSVGNSGAQFRLSDEAGTTLLNDAGDPIASIVVPAQVGPPVVPAAYTITGDADWFTEDQRDVNRYATPVWKAPSDMTVYVVLRTGGTAGAQAWFDGIKLEESTVATPWGPAAVGATTIDAGGVQVDGQLGGALRYRGTNGTTRDVVEGGARGLTFGGDVNVWSPTAEAVVTDGMFVSRGIISGGSGAGTGGWWAKMASGVVTSQFQGHHFLCSFGTTYGTNIVNSNSLASITVQWQAGPGNQPNCIAYVLPGGTATAADIAIVVTSVTPTLTYEVWVRSNFSYGTPIFSLLHSYESTGSLTPTRGQAMQAALPAGTVTYGRGWNAGLGAAGTTFPANPSAGDLFWRTDHNVEYMWSSPRWLSKTLYVDTSRGQNLAATGNDQLVNGSAWAPGGAIWLETLDIVFLINGGTALSASHSWQQTFAALSSGNVVGGQIAGHIVNSGAVSTWRRVTLPINGLITYSAANPSLVLNSTKVGTPGNLFYTAALEYRLVG